MFTLRFRVQLKQRLTPLGQQEEYILSHCEQEIVMNEQDTITKKRRVQNKQTKKDSYEESFNFIRKIEYEKMKENLLNQTGIEQTLVNMTSAEVYIDHISQDLSNRIQRENALEEMKKTKMDSRQEKINRKIPNQCYSIQNDEISMSEYHISQELINQFINQSANSLNAFMAQQRQIQKNFFNQFNDNLSFLLEEKKKLIKKFQDSNQQINNGLLQQIKNLKKMHVENVKILHEEIQERKNTQHKDKMKINQLNQLVNSLKKQIVKVKQYNAQLQKQTSSTNKRIQDIHKQGLVKYHQMESETKRKQNELMHTKCERRQTIGNRDIQFEKKTKDIQIQQKDIQIQQIKYKLQQEKDLNQKRKLEIKKLLNKIEEYKDHQYYFDSVESGHDLAHELKIQLLKSDLKIKQLTLENQQLRKQNLLIGNQLLYEKGLSQRQSHQSQEDIMKKQESQENQRINFRFI